MRPGCGYPSFQAFFWRDHLRKNLRHDKVILMGHSWGAPLGLLYVQAHPDKVSAFIGVNPLISKRAAEGPEYEFVLKEASQRSGRLASHCMPSPMLYTEPYGSV